MLVPRPDVRASADVRSTNNEKKSAQKKQTKQARGSNQPDKYWHALKIAANLGLRRQGPNLGLDDVGPVLATVVGVAPMPIFGSPDADGGCVQRTKRT